MRADGGEFSRKLFLCFLSLTNCEAMKLRIAFWGSLGNCQTEAAGGLSYIRKPASGFYS